MAVHPAQPYNPARLAFSPSIRLGRCEIVAPLGARGMGEVYKARDPRLEQRLKIVFSCDSQETTRAVRPRRIAPPLTEPSALF